MELIRLGLALALPWMVGAFWLGALLGAARRGPGGWALVLGGGYLLGALALTLIMRGIDALEWGQRFGTVTAAACAFALAGLVVFLVRSRGAGATPAPAERHLLGGGTKTLMLLLLVLVLVHFGMFAFEVAQRPLYPWDAWASWAPKARVWLALGSLVDFVSPQEWLAASGPAVYTVDAYHYPPAVPLMQLWMALALGRWDDALINLPWLVGGLALALALFGQCRLSGVGPLGALIAVYLLVSLPIFGTHVALGGYGDLWVAATFGMAAMSAVQWLQGRGWGFAYAALAFAVAATLVKAEGIVWSAVLAFVVLGSVVPRKLLYALLGAVVLGSAATLLVGGVEVSLNGLGELALTPEHLVIPGLGEFALGFHPVWDAFWEQYWIWDSWHLFWWGFAVVVLAAPWRGAGSFSLYLLSAAVLSVIAATFFLTENYLWAESVTSLNRVTLHAVPTLLFVAVLLAQSIFRSLPESSSNRPSSIATR